MAIPVIFVPGILGTRLVDDRRNNLWDPDQGVNWSNISGALRLGNPRSPALPNPSAGIVRDAWFRTRGVTNGGHLVWNKAYRELATALSDPRFSGECRQPIKLYVAGYDWRQSNIVSAGLLRQVVRQALCETRARRVVMIAHSMGGIVSRAFCKSPFVNGRPGHECVSRLVLLGSPTHGAPKAYRALRQSFVSPDDLSGLPLDSMDDSAMDFAGRQFARLLKQFPSVYELLPTQAYCRGNPDWLSFNTRRARLRDASSPAHIYRNRVTGLSGSATLLAARDLFDHIMGTYLPPRTVVVHGTNISDTEGAFHIAANGDLRQRRGHTLNAGDGTVPTYSGSVSGRRPVPPSTELSGIDHAGVARAPRAIRLIKTHIIRACVAQATARST